MKRGAGVVVAGVVLFPMETSKWGGTSWRTVCAWELGAEGLQDRPPMEAGICPKGSEKMVSF